MLVKKVAFRASVNSIITRCILRLPVFESERWLPRFLNILSVSLTLYLCLFIE